jgi:DNA repair exonuclease SbcCD ATPase subunit
VNKDDNDAGLKGWGSVGSPKPTNDQNSTTATMWQNFRDVRALAEKIGNVVAPVQADGDDYYEEEDEDGDEEDDENYEEEAEEEEVEFDEEDDELLADAAPQQTTPRSPFGFVGFLARAMDNEQGRYEGREKNDDDNDDHQDIVVEAQNDQHRHDHVENHGDDDDDDDEDQQPHASPTGKPEEVLPPSSNFETSFVSVDDLDLPRPAPSEKPTDFESPHEPPKMLVLQRESGSLSPMSPNKKFVSVLPDSDDPPPPMIRSSSTEKATLKVDTPPETPRRSVDTVITAVKQNASLENSPIAKAEQGPAHHRNDEPPNSLGENPVRGASSLRSLSATSSDHGMDSNGSRTEKLEKRCKELKRQLKHAEEEAERLRQSGDHDQLYRLFQEKEARLLEASNEEHEMEMRRLCQEMDETSQRYQQSMIEERTTFSQEHEQMNSLLQAANARNKELERENQKAAVALEKASSGQEQQHVRALRKVEDRLAQLMATVDERDERIVQLQRKVKDLESHISKDRDGANEAEEEMDELHQENETLHGQLDEMQGVNEALKKRLTALENGADELVRVKVRKASVGAFYILDNS